ncbi:hypothetical protein RU639_011794 [Aspergillus parasiticus]
MEHPIFQKVEGLPVIICKTCQCGVWPNEIVSHLKNRVHRRPHAEAVQTQELVQQWDGIAQDAQEATIPDQIDEPVPGLPTYSDRWMCCRDYPRCRYIGRSINSMRSHWRKVHGWSLHSRGRVSRQREIEGAAELQQSYILVTYQQIFPSRQGSHYIHAIEAVRKAVKEAQARAGLVVETDDIRDANPWLLKVRLDGTPIRN